MPEFEFEPTQVPYISPIATLKFGLGYRIVYNYHQKGQTIWTEVALTHYMHPTSIYNFMNLTSDQRLKMNKFLSEMRVESKAHAFTIWCTFNWAKVGSPHLVINYRGLNTRIESNQELRNTAKRLKLMYNKFLDKLIELGC